MTTTAVPTSASRVTSDHRPTNGSLLVISDDWGRHPSSCQHLVRRLLADYQVLWVNTIGTRTPKPDLLTLQRAAEKLAGWARDRVVFSASAGARDFASNAESSDIAAPEVAAPIMWPSFSRPVYRRLNQFLLKRSLTPRLLNLPRPITAVTTLPITADLTGQLPIDRWVYYCVDDFSVWPGLDGNTLRQMDTEMMHRADELIVVSECLQQLAKERGRSAELLTHGVDPAFWEAPSADTELPRSIRNLSLDRTRPVVTFWGVVDPRMDIRVLQAVSQRSPDAQLLLVGPQQNPHPELNSLPCFLPGPVAATDLPAIAARSQALIMPYADLPVTRAMQPLKLKEYLSTGKPVVCSPLPAVRAWQDCMDIGGTPEQFARLVATRLTGVVPETQLTARARLAQESWDVKARQFTEMVFRSTAHYNIPASESLADVH